jgi:poly-gamma-glutamate synthesis protein (capsule biosynthesis protein)
MKTKICITGDSILMSPLPSDYEAHEPIKEFIKQADVRINNLEMVISDYDCFASTFCGGVWLTATGAVLDDVCSFGFNCFGHANNHTMDYSYGGLVSTLDALEIRDVPVCGAGVSLQEATAPAYISAKNGRVAVLCISSTCNDAARAGDPGHLIPARPGVNMLRHSETFLVNKEHMAVLKEIADETYINGRINNSKRGGYTLTKPGVFSLGNVDFKLSEKEGKISSPNRIDMERMRKAIEEASEAADYIVVCFHSHEIKGDLDEEPDYFIEEFARACIDWGAAAVIGSGTHQIKAIELYKGKPIMYSIANFIFQSERAEHLPADYYEKYGVATDKTAEEAMAVRSKNGTVGLETEFQNYRGLMPMLEFENGDIKRIRIKPVELGFYAENKAHKGLPHEANEDLTREIFDTLRVLSSEYSTQLKLDGDVIEVVL